MTISSSLSAGVAGLNANATRLATISDNIANSGTYRVQARLDRIRQCRGRQRHGGPAPILRVGVRASTTRLIEERGDLIGTGNATGPCHCRARDAAGDQCFRRMGGSIALSDTPMTDDPNRQLPGRMPMGSCGRNPGLCFLAGLRMPTVTIPTLPPRYDCRSGTGSHRRQPDRCRSHNHAMNAWASTFPPPIPRPGRPQFPRRLSVEYFGNLGTSESLQIDLYRRSSRSTGASNQWTMQVRDSASGGALIGEPTTLTFDDTRGAGGTLRLGRP